MGNLKTPKQHRKAAQLLREMGHPSLAELHEEYANILDAHGIRVDLAPCPLPSCRRPPEWIGGQFGFYRCAHGGMVGFSHIQTLGDLPRLEAAERWNRECLPRRPSYIGPMSGSAFVGGIGSNQDWKDSL